MVSKRLQVPLIGLRRSGKSSMLNVVSSHLHPDDTLFLESTTKPAAVNIDAFLPTTITDMPGGILLGASKLEKGLPLTTRIGPGAPGPASAPADLLAWTDVSAVVFVIDAQDDYFEALSKLHTVILSAFVENQTIEFHVFIHKIDGYSEDYRQETLADIRGKVLDDLVDSSPSFVAQPWSYAVPQATKPKKEPKRGVSPANGYDASASEFSLNPQPGLVNLETQVRLHFHLTSIFDTSVFVAFSKVQQTLMQKAKSDAGDTTLADSVERLCDSICGTCKMDKAFLFDLPTRTYVGSDSTPFDAASFDVVFEYAGFLSKFSGLYANLPDPETEPRYASSVARLGPDTSLAFWQMNNHLALIAILKTEVHAKQSGMIDYNVCYLRRGVDQLYQLVQTSTATSS